MNVYQNITTYNSRYDIKNYVVWRIEKKSVPLIPWKACSCLKFIQWEKASDLVIDVMNIWQDKNVTIRYNITMTDQHD